MTVRLLSLIVVLFVGGQLAYAQPQKVNGVCGPANGVPSSLMPSSGLCASGTPSQVTQSGSNWVWVCWGSGHGAKSASCSAPIVFSPTLTLVVVPAAPQISDAATSGSRVATLQASWSDGSQFTGSIEFVAPNYSDGGLFSIVGNELVINGDVSALGNTVQHVTVEAVQ